jgi:hypothetical protein
MTFWPLSWSASFSMMTTASCRVEKVSRRSEFEKEAVHLVKLLRPQRHLLEVAHSLLRDPLLDFLDALVTVLAEEVGGASEICGRRVGQLFAFVETKRRRRLTTTTSIERIDNLGELGPVLEDELNGLVAELPSTVALARVAEDLLALGLELEVEADIDLLIAVSDHHAGGDLGEGKSRHADLTTEGMGGRVVDFASVGDASPEGAVLDLVVGEELQGSKWSAIEFLPQETLRRTAIRMARLPSSWPTT